MRNFFLAAALVCLFSFSAYAGDAATGASAELPIKVRVIGYQDTVLACLANDKDLVGWEIQHTFDEACGRLRERGVIPQLDNDLAFKGEKDERRG